MNSGRESGVYESYITRLVSSKFKPINLHRAILYGSKKLFDIFNMNWSVQLSLTENLLSVLCRLMNLQSCLNEKVRTWSTSDKVFRYWGIYLLTSNACKFSHRVLPDVHDTWVWRLKNVPREKRFQLRLSLDVPAKFDWAFEHFHLCHVRQTLLSCQRTLTQALWDIFTRVLLVDRYQPTVFDWSSPDSYLESQK